MNRTFSVKVLAAAVCRRSTCCRNTIRSFPNAAVVLCAALCSFLCIPFTANAQAIPPNDSLQVERLIELYGSGDFVSSARRALAARFRDGDYPVIALLLRMVPKRRGGANWLSPEEELLVRTLIADLPSLRDREAFTQLLAARVQRPGGNTAYSGDVGAEPSEQNLLGALRGWLRNDAGLPAERIRMKGGDSVELAFFSVLINAQQITSVRKVADVNHTVDRFVAAYPDSYYALLADRYLRLTRTPSPFGAGFFLGYTYGGMVGSESGIPGKSDGPTLGGELYLHNWTATGELMLGRLSLSDSFAVRGQTWQPGSAVLVGGTFGLGYQFQTGDGLITPFAGGAFFDLQEDPAGEKRQNQQSTGLRTGIALGTIVAYRIPFDRGPHIDLRVRVSAIFPGFGGYSSQLNGGLLLVGASFGFVGRPYRVEPARNVVRGGRE